MAPPLRKAVFPAAGLGTRFLPATKAQPKEMLPLVDKPTIQYVIEEAVRAGIDDVIVVTGRGKEAIADHFGVENGAVRACAAGVDMLMCCHTPGRQHAMIDALEKAGKA